MSGPLGEIFDHGGVFFFLFDLRCLPGCMIYRLRCAQYHGVCHFGPPLSSSYVRQLEVLLASVALGLGRSWWIVASQIATLANFYLTTWEEYHTGMLPIDPRSFIFLIFRVRTAGPWIFLGAG